MVVTPVKTDTFDPNTPLIPFLDRFLKALTDQTIVVITSKIVSLSQGRVVKNDGTVTKEEIIKREAESYITRPLGQYDIYLTLKGGTLIANAGVDESNADDHFILWPQNPHHVAKTVWEHLRTKHHVGKLGVLITDSYLAPMRWGTRGFGLAWCGFRPLRDYRGRPDIYGRQLRMTQASVLDALAAAAVIEMGEGDEKKPIATITEARVDFTDVPPDSEEIQALRIDPNDDLYSPFLTSVDWRPGS